MGILLTILPKSSLAMPSIRVMASILGAVGLALAN